MSIILRSLKNGRYYTGSTNNIERRFIEHNSGGSKYTKLTKPFTLIHKEEFNTRKEVVGREKFLKSGVGRILFMEMKKRDVSQFYIF